MTYTEICARLDGHLHKLPNAPPTVFDNSPAVYPDAGLFLTAVNLPAVRQTADFCGSLKQTGIYSINIYAPVGKGAGEAAAVADRLDAHFSRTDLGGLWCDTAVINRIGASGAHFIINISVSWRTHHQRTTS